MFNWIGSIISIIRALIDLVKYINNFIEEQRLKEAERKRVEREKAIADLETCKTEEECDAASDRLHDNSN